MQRATRFCVGVLTGCLLGASVPGMVAAEDDPLERVNTWYAPHGEVTGDDWTDLEGEWTVQGGFNYYAVEDDEGRFRQDRYIDDDFTAGVQQLRYRDENLDVVIRAVYEDLYGAEAHYIRPDAFRVDFEFERHRYYYDGSTVPWNPAVYQLPESFAETPDENLFTDRVDLNLEGTLLVPDLPHVKVGWHHWERFGNEVLLRGGRARNDPAGIPRIRATPVVNDVDGQSDTIYIEVPFTLEDKYNFSIRQEYEEYRDDQFSTWQRMGNPGAQEQRRSFDDDLRWREWRTFGTFNSFITDDVYVSANYYHGDLENTSRRDVLRQNGAGTPNVLRTDTVDGSNTRDADVLALSLAFLNIAEHGQLKTAFRVEHTDTHSNSDGFNINVSPVDPVRQRTEQEETRLGESARFVWKGVRNTTVTLDGEWEQRYLDESGFWDVSDLEINVPFGPGNLAFLQRSVDINSNDQEYTVTVVNRPRRDVRLTGRYRYAHKERDYNENLDVELSPALVPIVPQLGFYPGVLGDMEQDISEVTLKGDWHFLPAWTTTLKYQFETNEIEYDIQNTEGQDLDVHRISSTVFGSPCAGLTLTGMGMFEHYELNTPLVGNPLPGFGNNDFAPGTRPFDYEYDAFVLFGSGSYRINTKWDANCAYQHTENNGSDVNNSLDEIWLGLDYKLAEDKIIQIKYEYFDFEDELGNGFDDYNGHGVSLAFAYRF